jgi:hypothetical protein
MPECTCPNCSTIFRAPSSAFGTLIRCPSCRSEYPLLTEYLARFDLPDSIHLQFREPSGKAFTRFSVPVLVQYGYDLPPLRSDASGQLLIDKAMFLRAQSDEINHAAMDHKGDYSLNRHVRIMVPNRSQGRKLADARMSYGSYLFPYEKELYRNMRALAAYVPAADIVPFVILVDLLTPVANVRLEPIVNTP